MAKKRILKLKPVKGHMYLEVYATFNPVKGRCSHRCPYCYLMKMSSKQQQAFATENQAELFTKKKSLDMTHGTIGFRTGTPKLKTLKGFTWASAVNLVKEFLPSFIRTSEEVAKDKLLADRDEEGMTEKMAKCGIQVVQDETFYVDPKKEETE